MPAFFIYLLKANIALTIFYLAYHFGWRRLTFYTLNRVFLIAGILFSAVYPAINFNAFLRQHEQLAARVVGYFPNLQQAAATQSVLTVWDILFYVFWLGVAAMSTRLILQLIALWRLHTHTAAGRIYGNKVRMTSKKINPFSFLRNIYINPSLHDLPELQTILQHERMHVIGWHTADVLLAELNQIFYWFNPGAWLMKQAVKENLEFIVDRKVLKAGIDAKVYQYSLVRTTVTQAAAPVSYFSLTHLKNRIMMMNKKSSSKLSLLKYLLLLPAVAVILVFTISKAQDKDQGTAGHHAGYQGEAGRLYGNLPVYTIPAKHDTLSPTPTKKVLFKFRPISTPPKSDTLPDSKYTPPAKKPRLIFTPPKIKKDTSTAMKKQDKQISAILDTIKFKKGTILLDADNGKNFVIIRDGKGIRYADHIKDSPSGNTIKTVSGSKTYTFNYKIAEDTMIPPAGTQQAGDHTMESAPRKSPAAEMSPLYSAIYFVDGKKTSWVEFKKVPPGNIASITVLKGEDSYKAYGDAGREGVIIITTKNRQQGQAGQAEKRTTENTKK